VKVLITETCGRRLELKEAGTQQTATFLRPLPREGDRASDLRQHDPAGAAELTIRLRE